MAKKGVNKKGKTRSTEKDVSSNPITLREEVTGKLQAKGGSRNPKSFLKRDHLKKLSLWATEDAGIPSLAAFFGRQFAAVDEALGNPPDPSLFSCQRCETILRPGINCTIRIAKYCAKPRHKSKKPSTPARNAVVFKCHFCSHQNRMRGTPKGYLKEICPPTPKPPANSQCTECIVQKSISSENEVLSKNEKVKVDEVDMATPSVSGTASIANSPATPLLRTGFTLLDAKKRKRNKSGKKKLSNSNGTDAAADVEKTVAPSRKRKRKTWTSLKEIVEKSDHGRMFTDIKMPLFP